MHPGELRGSHCVRGAEVVGGEGRHSIVKPDRIWNQHRTEGPEITLQLRVRCEYDLP